MSKRIVEVFSAGCTVCDPTVELVQSLACPSCDVQVVDMHTDVAKEKATAYGVKTVPAVAVDGKLLDCCRSGVDSQALRDAGVGRAL